MKILTCFVVLLAAVAVPCKATDVRAQYVGKSGCAAEFKTSINDYGVRLDKSKRARLEAHTFKAQTLLTIVQYRSNSDRCGVVRDVIAADRPDNSFVWECFDKTAPEDVVVGTWPGEYSRTSGPALQAWRIDLKKLKFVRLKGAVTCTAGNYAGSDRGEDLATWAHTRSQRP